MELLHKNHNKGGERNIVNQKGGKCDGAKPGGVFEIISIKKVIELTLALRVRHI